MSDNLAERMVKLETKVDGINEKVDTGFKESKERHGELKSNIVALGDKIDDFVDKADIKYAPKRDVDDLKDNQKWLVRIIVAVVVLAILALVVNHFQVPSV